ncbi:hypothetical protein BJX64DRAFT_288294 [Aspergillus heterothallicus]
MRARSSFAARLPNITYSFSYPAILAITETQSERPENTNPLDVTLMTPYSNFTEYSSRWGSLGNLPGKDTPFVVQSIEVARPGSRIFGDGKPFFNLTVGENSGNGSPFRVTDWWGVVPVMDGEVGDLKGLMNPTIQLSFNNASVSFDLRSSILANTLGEANDEE